MSLEAEGPSTSEPKQGGKENNPEGTNGQESSNFDCNICLEIAREPVVTLCGHLFCWPCLYQWLQMGKSCKECPVCKAGVQESSVIPLYGRGQTNPKDPRKRTPENIPNRPAGQRPTPQRNYQSNFGFNFMPPSGPFATAQIGNITFSAGIGLFPSLFGFQFQTMNNGQPNPSGIDPNGQPLRNHEFEPQTPEQQQRDFLSKVLLVLGSFVILCLIYF